MKLPSARHLLTLPIFALSLTAAPAHATKPGPTRSSTPVAPTTPGPAPPWEQASRSVAPSIARPRAERALCSFSEPICVHAANGVAADAVLRALARAEAALRLFRDFGLPNPLADGGRGGTMAFDIYLTAQTAARAHVDAIPVTVGLDRAATFATVDPSPPGPPCLVDSDVSRVVAQAMLLGVDAGIHEGILAAQSSWLAEAASPCPAAALDAIDRVQQRPDLAIANATATHLSGNMVFPWFLDDAYGTGTRGRVLTGLLSIACQFTLSDSRHYVNEPDVFDALRQVTLDREMNFGELLVDFAIARAFMGNRSDHAHLIDSEWLGAMGRVRFEWAIPWAGLPRRLAPGLPLEPTGAGYLWLDLAGAPDDAELLVVADWEETHVFQWAAVRVDAEGREVGRHLFGGLFGENQAQLSLRDLQDASALLVVGTYLGKDDRSKPYDPEDGDPEGAGYTVTFHAQ